MPTHTPLLVTLVVCFWGHVVRKPVFCILSMVTRTHHFNMHSAGCLSTPLCTVTAFTPTAPRLTPLPPSLIPQMDTMTNMGEEVAHKVMYDDVNESMCHRGIVHKALYLLGVTPQQMASGSPCDAFISLATLGCPLLDDTFERSHSTLSQMSEVPHDQVRGHEGSPLIS